MHQRLHESVVPQVMRQQQLDRRGELEPPGHYAEQPAGDGDEEQPRQQPHQFPPRQLRLGEVAGVQQQHRHRRVLDEPEPGRQQPAGRGSRYGAGRILAQRADAHHDDHEELPHGSERRSRGGEERPPLVDVAPDRLARDDERMSHVGDAERIRERRGRERRDGRGGGERAGVPPARNAARHSLVTEPQTGIGDRDHRGRDATLVHIFNRLRRRPSCIGRLQ